MAPEIEAAHSLAGVVSTPSTRASSSPRWLQSTYRLPMICPRPPCATQHFTARRPGLFLAARMVMLAFFIPHNLEISGSRRVRPCLTDADFVALASGSASARQIDEWDRHITTCDSCGARYARVQQRHAQPAEEDFHNDAQETHNPQTNHDPTQALVG